MQLHYVKSKLDLANKRIIDNEFIQSLVIANPYTRGLQQLMLAFASDGPAAVKQLVRHQYFLRLKLNLFIQRLNLQNYLHHLAAFLR